MDWIGVALNLFGWWLMPRHKVTAAMVFFVGNAVWLAWAVAEGIPSIIFIQTCLAIMKARTLYHWRQEERP